MTHDAFDLTGDLARAARALVSTSAADTAEQAGLSRRQLRDFEKGLFPLVLAQRQALATALSELGAHFLTDGTNQRGHGVQLKFSAAKSARVESWEDEGGLAAEDDV